MKQQQVSRKKNVKTNDKKNGKMSATCNAR